MTESSLTQVVQAHLRSRGFLVFKHADRFTVGIPDTTASKGGITWWLEFKLIKLKAWPIGLMMGDHLSPEERGVQLATMVQLQKAARAMYLLFIVTGDRWRLAPAAPDSVLLSVKNGWPIPCIEVSLDQLVVALEVR